AGAGLCALSAEKDPKEKEKTYSAKALVLSVGQKEFVSKEPILIQVRSTESGARGTLPSFPLPVPGKGFRFEVVSCAPAPPGKKEAPPPAYRKRPKPLNPLPLEEKGRDPRVRLYDLQEWYDFPAEGTFKIKASVDYPDFVLSSNEVE